MDLAKVFVSIKDTAEIALALVIGKKDGISNKIMDDFRKSGTAHLL